MYWMKLCKMSEGRTVCRRVLKVEMNCHLTKSNTSNRSFLFFSSVPLECSKNKKNKLH